MVINYVDVIYWVHVVFCHPHFLVLFFKFFLRQMFYNAGTDAVAPHICCSSEAISEKGWKMGSH